MGANYANFNLGRCCSICHWLDRPDHQHSESIQSQENAANDDELREAVKKVVPLNMGALLLSTFGLMMVILGIFLK